MTTYRVSADIGGTFTDIVIEPSDGPVYIGKVATTPDNPARGVIDGIRASVPDLSAVEFFVHGTTVGLNAFLERKGERVMLICSAGARDSYTIARGNRQTLYEIGYQKPEQLVPRRDVHEVRGRIAWDGRELEALCAADFEPIIDKARAEGINAIAVCFLHAYAYPEHELQAAEILRAALPEVSVSLSHTVAREWREYERASSTVMNAYVAPVMQRYLHSLQTELAAEQVGATVHIMQSSGGVTTAASASRHPVFTLLSGPVGGTIAGTALAAASGRGNLLCVDMGGTSFDLSLVIDGKANTTLETELEGLPLLMSVVDIQTIGTGGGSIAWLDGDAVRVGPHSAGSQPGPACYGRGGRQPTVTDANLFLGRLGTASLLGGEMKMDLEACQRAVQDLAAAAGIEATAFAEGILAISNAAMADAMRTITVSQGVDPREFTLVAFGGAGPMAAVFLAEELDIDAVMIPRFPGTFSAWGMLKTDLRQDFTQNFYQPAENVEGAEIEAIFARLAGEGSASLAEEGVAAGDISHQRSADMRYKGQEYTINVAIAPGADIAAISADFHRAHERRYGHCNDAAPVEFVNLRLASFGALKKYRDSAAPAPTEAEPALIAQRPAVFAGRRYETPVYARARLAADSCYPGPAIVEEQSATTVVPPGWQLALDAGGNLLLSRHHAEGESS
ncbi:hydantoinase/oxoprolinase family protein [Exilibacterium tricleocarpae]|uniref:Hydantoinase/oxoprolinase family protein n=1 Tax=Exilibacterium tricleocarpae TaxID=2591008 RepID=A0A545SQK6_9GAMM|nr:hydantoinase/oxoprolinase family protein [Exilibacterium tricleocarpae]TQV67254.1 hydantoinase/oxoprolinase family protein [Exilibacterium tricleocarpae]